MSIFKLNPDQVETFTVVTNPSRFFSSSSNGQISGSVYITARRSPSDKDAHGTVPFTENKVNDSALVSTLQNMKFKSQLTDRTDINKQALAYLQEVNSQAAPLRQTRALSVERFSPSVDFTKFTLRKNIIRKTLIPYYRLESPSYNWGVTNYNCFNFFSASSLPTGSALLYPSYATQRTNGLVSGAYALTGAFSFDFYINPKYTNDHALVSYTPGTLFHLSSTYAVSLVTGSARDCNGIANTFRVLLQLSHSADIAPETAHASALADTTTYPNDLIFLSSDNALIKNEWHHVVIRWGGSSINNGTGSFIVNKRPAGVFVVPSSSIAPAAYAYPNGNPDVLVVGNYYRGTNSFVNQTLQSYFFAADPASRDGLVQLDPITGIDYPNNFRFINPLNAEVHDLCIRNSYLTDATIYSGSGIGPKNILGMLFYVPPFFTRESPNRRLVGSYGGVLKTPFYAADGSTSHPFNVDLSFGVAAHDVNLENYCRNFANGTYPRLLELTATQISVTDTQNLSANQYFWNQAGVRKRNLLVLPCDDGNFTPNFDLLSTGSTAIDLFADDYGNQDLSSVSLLNMVTESMFKQSLTVQSGTLFNNVVGPSPQIPTNQPGSTLAVFQRTGDSSSNEMTFFNVSNLFYGNSIKPGSLVLTDVNVSGSNGKMRLNLRDDGYGNIYRGDCATSHSKWNSCGNVFYTEGLIAVKSHLLPFFGKDGFEISFKGEQNIHVMKFNVIAPANHLNSSSNPSYLPVSASSYAFDSDRKFVQISGINFHDDNLNVIMKTKLAQPIIKRSGERLLFRVKIDT